MQAKQYEERILKLQDALEMQKLKNTSQLGRIRTLEEQLQQAQAALEEERAEKETILKNRRTNRLLLELQEERVQRLQDLEEIYAKDKQLEALVTEVGMMSKGVNDAKEEITHKDAEAVGLRASLRVSAKLIQKAEHDFLETHRELEATQLKLLQAKRMASEKEAEVREWIERYEQVMLDLHVAQFRLTQLARDASSKEAALARGFAVDIERSSSDVAIVRARPFDQMIDVGKSDRAARKFRQDLIPHRSQSLTAAINPDAFRHSSKVGELSLTKGHKPRSFHPDRGAGVRMSRDCYQCIPNEPIEPLSAVASTKRTGCDQLMIHSDPIVQQRLNGSKYLGHGLGLLKKDHVVPSADI